ncbi:MAG: hypothetical protein PV362_13130 [Providencia heimbachae]|nr:hypothetical protein [Providencia heimbachae]
MRELIQQHKWFNDKKQLTQWIGGELVTINQPILVILRVTDLLTTFS